MAHKTSRNPPCTLSDAVGFSPDRAAFFISDRYIGQEAHAAAHQFFLVRPVSARLHIPSRCWAYTRLRACARGQGLPDFTLDLVVGCEVKSRAAAKKGAAVEAAGLLHLSTEAFRLRLPHKNSCALSRSYM